ncbi:hypothetical protein C6Q14_05140 [Burkholderia ambifaria]|nr:hypothetical protein C6Q14_05140 [Burkholderia ambifaria]
MRQIGILAKQGLGRHRGNLVSSGETVSVAPHRRDAQTQIVRRPDSGVPVDQPGRLRIQSAVS